MLMSSTPSSSPSVKYPNDGWGNSLERMSSFTRAEMNQHITNSGKKVANIQHHSIPTNLKKAKTFLTDQYLKDIGATSDQRHFYLRAKCYHSFKKSEAPHDLRFCLCLVSGQVVHAKCSCKAGQVGYCNHVLALMFKVCKFSLYDSKNTSDLCDEEDEQPDLASTSFPESFISPPQRKLEKKDPGSGWSRVLVTHLFSREGSQFIKVLSPRPFVTP